MRDVYEGRSPLIARELLITSLRGSAESSGQSFGAQFSGKLKMVFQCIAAGASLFYLAWQPTWLPLPGMRSGRYRRICLSLCSWSRVGAHC